jgi:hypothetical protein
MSDDTPAMKKLLRTLKFLAAQWLRMGGKCPKGSTVIHGECPTCEDPAKKRNPFCRMGLQMHKQMKEVDEECPSSN